MLLASCSKGQTEAVNRQSPEMSAVSSEQIRDMADDPKIAMVASEVKASSKYPGYKTYNNYRFGYSIDYPGDFIRTMTAANGDGIEIASPDKQATLKVAGGNNGTLNIKDLYDLSVKGIKGELGYNILEESWFVLTWREDGRINYEKVFVEKGIHYGFTFSYPEDQKAQYDDLVTKIEASFGCGERRY